MRGLLVVLCATAACGGDSPADASVDAPADGSDARSDAGPMVSPITAPALPRFDCPPAWRSVPREDLAPGLTLCEPWPEDYVRCAAHEMRLPGEAACRTVGRPCPADGFAPDLPTTGVIYVRAGSSAPPDGSRDAPYPEIAPALAAMDATTTTLALGPGTYDDRLSITQDLTVEGACAERTELTNRLFPVQIADGLVVSIASLSIANNLLGTLSGADVTFDGVAFQRARFSFIGERLEVTDSVFRDGSDALDYSIAVNRDSEVVLERILIEDTNTNGILLGGTGESRLTDVYVRNVRRGIVLGGTTLVMERVVLDGFLDSGLTGLEGGEMTDVVIRGGITEGVISTGLVLSGAWTVDRLYASDAGLSTLTIGGGDVTMRDAVVESTSDATDMRVQEIELLDTTLNVERALVSGADHLALLFSGASTSARLADLTVRDVTGRPDGWGRCLHAQFGSAVTVDRAHLEGCTEAAVTAYSGATFTLRDVRIADTRASPCPDPVASCDLAAGIGLVALEGGRIDGERFEVATSALVGVMILPDADTDLRDGVVRDCPVGINVQDETYDLSRVMDRVVYVNNGANLDTSALPVPRAEAMVAPSF